MCKNKEKIDTIMEKLITLDWMFNSEPVDKGRAWSRRTRYGEAVSVRKR